MIADGRRACSPPSLAARPLVRALAIAMISSALVACGSTTYRPTPPDQVGLFDRMQERSSRGVRVRVAVPSDDESVAIFGLPLHRRGIQPVWIEVRNDTPHRLRFVPVGTDPDYFPPFEVAYMFKRSFRGAGERDLQHHLEATAMTRWIWPDETRAGWVYTHDDPGTKAFNVDLFYGLGDDESFSFFVDVPGRTPDHAAIDIVALYRDDQRARVHGDELPGALAALGCCTRDATGERLGRPLNVAIVGPGREVLKALLRARFFERPRSERSVDVELEPRFDGRPPDAVFRTRHSRKAERNELRLWRAPIDVDGTPVWVGRISHYIGRDAGLGLALLDAQLDPDIDDARDFMLQTMWYAQTLEQLAWQRVSAPVPVGSPARDERGRSYFWDGYRVVMWLSGEPVSQSETRNARWDEPPAGGLR